MSNRVEEREKWVFEINNEIIDEYAKYYFQKYPGRKKHPLAKTSKSNVKPCIPSLNEINASIRMVQNDWKQRWKEFIVYLVEKQGYQGLKLKNVKIIVDFYFWDNKKRDIGDNYNLKFINDGLVSSGFLEDDSCVVLQQVTYRYRGVDKNNPRVIITVEKLNDDEIIK